MTARTEAIRTERRRRDSDGLAGRRRKLSVMGELDHDNYVYRWANDEGTRLHDLTVRDDWDLVQDRNETMGKSGMGAEAAVPVGVGPTGAPVRAVLLRKRKDWHEKDEKAAQARIDEQETGLKAGAVPGAESDGHTYSPQGITLQHRGGRS